MDISANICTRGRYDSLALTICAVAHQTLRVKELIIYDDNDNPEDLRKRPLYQGIFSMLDQLGIGWQVTFTGGKGQVAGHKRMVKDAKSDFIYRVDDDCVPEAACLEKLMLVMESASDIGACGGLVLDVANKATSEVASSKIQDIYLGLNVQWFTHKDKRPYEVDHLYSTFVYKRGVDYYPSNLSRVGHREETIATYRMKKAGQKLYVVPEAITWHLKGNSGGIRDGYRELWDKDEAVFAECLKDWGVKTNDTKLITLDNGLGDHYAFLDILPEVMARYPNLILACCYPDVFRNAGVRCISIAEAHIGDHREGIYKWMVQNNWKKGIIDAYKACYLN